LDGPVIDRRGCTKTTAAAPAHQRRGQCSRRNKVAHCPGGGHGGKKTSGNLGVWIDSIGLPARIIANGQKLDRGEKKRDQVRCYPFGARDRFRQGRVVVPNTVPNSSRAKATRALKSKISVGSLSRTPPVDGLGNTTRKTGIKTYPGAFKFHSWKTPPRKFNTLG